jgi:hypothetical protein
LSSIERSASVQIHIASRLVFAQDAINLSRGDFGYIGFAKLKLRGGDNEHRGVPALTTGAGKENVGVSFSLWIERAVMLSD